MSEKEVRKIFSSKKALLEYLGKNGKDTRLVDRMIGKGEVQRLEDGGYELVQNMSGEEVAALREKVAEQEKRIVDLELDLEMCQAEKEAAQKWGVTMEELKYATAQWHYYEEEYEKEKKDKENRIRKCFQRIKARNPKASRDEFRDWVMSNE